MLVVILAGSRVFEHVVGDDVADVAIEDRRFFCGFDVGLHVWPFIESGLDCFLDQEAFLDVVVPGLAVRLAVDEDVQPHQHRPRLAVEDDILHVRRRGRIDSFGPVLSPRRARQEEHSDHQGEEELQIAPGLPGAHPTISLMTLASGAAMRMGRPTFDRFCVLGSMPTALTTVARKSATEAGLSSTVVPSALVLP